MTDERSYTRDPLVRTFGVILRAHREAAGLSRPQLAAALGCQPGWIEKLETAQKPPSEATADDLDVFFKTPARLFWHMWREIKREGKHVVLPPGFEGYLQLEAEASTMYVFEINLVKGLFQTPEYAYEVLKSGRTTEEVEQLVAKRMERQAVLARPKPPRIIAVFDENAIRRMIGGREVMRAQLQRLIEIAEQPNVTMQIVPSGKGSYAGVLGAFTILGFTDRSSAVYVEGHTSGQLIADLEEIRTYTWRYDLIRSAALPTDESLKLLGTILESL